MLPQDDFRSALLELNSDLTTTISKLCEKKELNCEYIPNKFTVPSAFNPHMTLIGSFSKNKVLKKTAKLKIKEIKDEKKILNQIKSAFEAGQRLEKKQSSQGDHCLKPRAFQIKKIEIILSYMQEKKKEKLDLEDQNILDLLNSAKDNKEKGAIIAGVQKILKYSGKDLFKYIERMKALFLETQLNDTLSPVGFDDVVKVIDKKIEVKRTLQKSIKEDGKNWDYAVRSEEQMELLNKNFSKYRSSWPKQVQEFNAGDLKVDINHRNKD